MKGRYSALAAILTARALADLPPRPSYPGFVLKFEDDFNGPLNERVWHVANGYVQNAYAGLQDLVCYTRDSAYTENGNLVLRTRAQSVTCNGINGVPTPYAFTSGWVDTLDRVTVVNGLVEVRARLPQPRFRVWPSAFLNSQRNRRDQGLCWPIANEIDMYEVAGGFGGNSMCGSYHWGYECRRDLGATRFGCLPGSDTYSNDFHVYAVEWDGNGITWRFDGREFYRMDRSTDGNIVLPPDEMNIILETALAWWIEGGPADVDATGVFHYIDWVRVWTRV
jgi:beta-glucanase (GH16 family)